MAKSLLLDWMSSRDECFERGHIATARQVLDDPKSSVPARPYRDFLTMLLLSGQAPHRTRGIATISPANNRLRQQRTPPLERPDVYFDVADAFAFVGILFPSALNFSPAGARAPPPSGF